jgi:hypothetical protein
VQSSALAIEGLLGQLHCGLERAGSCGQRYIVQTTGEGLPFRLGDLAAGKLVESAARRRAKTVGVDVIQRDPDDAASRDESGTDQVVQARQ